jgi:uncharacterized protein (TIGR04255 family)
MTGRMAKPPVFYTIGVIKFNAVLDIEAYITKIQKDLRHEYPDFSQDLMTSFQIHAPTSKQPDIQTTLTTRWHFRDASTTSGYAVTANSLMFHTTEYKDSDHFIESLLKGVTILHSHVNLSYLDGVAVRILDAVVPREGEGLDIYLQPGALGLRDVYTGKILQSITAAVFGIPNGQLTTRSIFVQGKIGIPIELNPIGLRFSDRIQAVDQPHVVLDNDCQSTERSAVDLKDIESRVRAVKVLTKQAFDRSITTRAIEIWNEL